MPTEPVERSPYVSRLIAECTAPAPTPNERDDDLFQDAWITSGEALDKALKSMGLKLDEPQPRPPSLVLQAAWILAGVFVLIGLAAMVWGAFGFSLSDFAIFAGTGGAS